MMKSDGEVEECCCVDSIQANAWCGAVSGSILVTIVVEISFGKIEMRDVGRRRGARV
jgi:hypothetical protein